MEETKVNMNPNELPFLVTHWLSNFQSSSGDRAAVQRIHAAGSELAAAFCDLGMFGTTHSKLSSASIPSAKDASHQNNTYHDMKRTWNRVPPNQLELMASSASAVAAVAPRPSTLNLLQLAHEIRPSDTNRLRLVETIDLTSDIQDLQHATVSSVLQPLPLVGAESTEPTPLQRILPYKGPEETTKPPLLPVTVISNQASLAQKTGDAMRTWLALKEKMVSIRDEQTTLQQARQVNDERIVAQLGIKLSQITAQMVETQQALVVAESEARQTAKNCQYLRLRFRDPTTTSNQSSLSKNILHHVISRSTCSVMPRKRPSVLANRISHALTINAHLTFPVYCLKFDVSGRYFITGADDCLVKLFLLGATASTQRKRYTYGGRGAVLVATLRGHAGVICDIAVSTDNAFLATASDDGDVRVWGLKDGSPIAILRGHAGGANMVSWSKLSPYRLVTSGMDGLARIWDIREAALKRYGTHVGNRVEYTLTLTDAEKVVLHHGSQVSTGPDESIPVVLPPLPQRASDVEEPVMVGLPPLPPGNEAPVVDALPAQPAAAAAPENPGAFIANDTLDEGVKLVAKLQHGEIRQEANGPGTRSKRKTVKVICVARCPTGGHFATGSDDGLCRVWEDDDDEQLAVIDCRGIVNAPLHSTRRLGRSSSNSHVVPSTSKLLNTLVGHMSAVTDLHYSHAGDRILTASQKDGNARLWSFGDANQNFSTGGTTGLRDRFRQSRQIVLRLSKIGAANRVPARGGRKRGANASNTSSSAITCDVAVWTADDSKIVTSQSCPLKSNSQDAIVPGSQLILVWDSWTGNCLLAIKQAHKAQCPVILPHPLDPTYICTAGADGVAKMWNLETGKCIFLHKNTLENDPVAQNNEKGKECGYLDGTFDKHGQTLLLTDDNGRISIFDCLQGTSLPAWMRDQYFANDYYELFYNSNGYCVERGSEQPPHLAPRAARCNHAGAAWSDDISETFKTMRGPSPVSEGAALMERRSIRSRSQAYRYGEERLQRAIIMTDFDPDRTVQINGSSEMVLGESEMQTDARRFSELVVANGSGVPLRRATTSSGNQLSSNYRWIDYYDLVREEGGNDADLDVGDDDFVPQPVARNDEEENFSDGVLVDSDSDTSARPTRSRVVNNSRSQRRRRRDQERSRNEDFDPVVPHQQPTRSSSRRPVADDDSDEDDGIIDECLSTNNTPSGPFVNDYLVDGHFFKLATMTTQVNRGWLSREESTTSFQGKKAYTPQVGDSIVYIPKAHSDLIREFPTLKTPWRKWPSGTRWPIVRCQVRNIRYRFPYKDYFRRRGAETKCVSIVAILTLEVTGIPELSADREFPWPKPQFIGRQTRSSVQLFEVSLFESGFAEYIIPEALFLWRVKCLEQVLRQRANDPAGLSIVATCMPDTTDEDPVVEDWSAKLIEYAPTEEDGDEHLNKSGYNSLLIVWDTGGNEELSPWEVTIPEESYNAPNPPSLAATERRAVVDSLRAIEETPGFGEFCRPVDYRRYPDYLTRVEIPMDMNQIKRRLHQNYYFSTVSVMADVRLIRENCCKYNGSDAEISLKAYDLCTTFKELLKENLAKVGAAEESINSMDQETEIILDPNLPSTPREEGPRTRSSVVATSLESLPPPLGQPSTRQTRASTGGTSRGGRSSLTQTGTPILGRTLAQEDTNGESYRVFGHENTRGSARRNARDNGVSSLGTDFGEEARVTRSRHITDENDDPTRLNAVTQSQRIVGRGRHYAEEDDTKSSDESDSEDSVEEDVDNEEEEELEADADANVEVLEPISAEGNRSGSLRPTSTPVPVSPRRQSGRARAAKTHYHDFESDDNNVEVTADLAETSRGNRRGEAASKEDKNSIGETSLRISLRKRSAKKYIDESEVELDEDEESPTKNSKSFTSRGQATVRQSTKGKSTVPASPRRQSGRTRMAKTQYQDLESDVDMVEEQGELGRLTRGRRVSSVRKAGTSAPSGPSSRTPAARETKAIATKAIASHIIAKDNNDSPHRKGLRVSRDQASTRNLARGRRTRQHETPPSEVDDTKEEMKSSRRRRGATTIQVKVSARPSRSAASVLKYVDEESEFDDEEESDEVHYSDDDEEDFDEEIMPRKKRGKTGKREESDEDVSVDDDEGEEDVDEKSHPTSRPAAKRRRTSNPNDVRSANKRPRGVSKTLPTLPEVPVWPSVPLKDIGIVAERILNQFRELDESGFFLIPVPEAFPAIKKAYLKKIKHPMDFRTIEEDHLPMYEKISRLQEDLILIFRNCVDFNGVDTEYGRYAIALWEQMTDVFEGACKELGVMLPRRWKS